MTLNVMFAPKNSSKLLTHTNGRGTEKERLANLRRTERRGAEVATEKGKEKERLRNAARREALR